MSPGAVPKSRLYTRTNQFLLDFAASAAALVAAFAAHSEGKLGPIQIRQLLLWLPLVIVVRFAVNGMLGVYRLVWRFVSLSDALKIAGAFLLTTLLFFGLVTDYPSRAPLAELVRIPLSVVFLEGLLSLFLALGLRTLRRLQHAGVRRRLAASNPETRVLLYGAGRAGVMLRREMDNNIAYDVVGFVDDDPQKKGRIISDTRVLGCGDDLHQLVDRHHVDEVIITMATASRATLARILAKCRRSRVPAKLIPSLREILSGQVQISDLRETKVEEVLGRESVEVQDFEALAGPAYRGKRVLVTGAGGSIGSELVRQLWRLEPSRIAILDKDENAVYELDQEARRRGVTIPLESHIADVRELSRLRAIFADFRPQVVFHAAAHKHVPLMEIQPCEAVLNNVGGTKNVLDVSAESGVERFVFISTDKAVNPVNVMGATKRIGEMLVQSQLRNPAMRYACVRFGNVLGSRGSVVPLFKKQIAEGGPVTVTHPDVVRYFMTIQEAVQLILCAGTLAEHGEIFVLDMGNHRNILELAREMILLSGLEPEKDIQTVITGLRPGEKLYEDLVAASETLSTTSLPKVSMIRSAFLDCSTFAANVSYLLQCARNNDRERLLGTLSAMGIGYSEQPVQAQRLRAMAAGSPQIFEVLAPQSQSATPSLESLN